MIVLLTGGAGLSLLMRGDRPSSRRLAPGKAGSGGDRTDRSPSVIQPRRL